MCYGESPSRISSWYVSSLFLYGLSNLHFYHEIVSMGIVSFFLLNVEFLKFDFNSLDLFILLMHMHILNQLATCYLHLPFLLFRIWSQWFTYSLSTNYACMLPLQTSYAWTHNFITHKLELKYTTSELEIIIWNWSAIT